MSSVSCVPSALAGTQAGVELLPWEVRGKCLDESLPGPSAAGADWSRWSKLLRGLVHRRLRALRGGTLEVQDPLGTTTFGESSGPRTRLHIRTPRAYGRLVREGELGFAAGILSGEIACDDLFSLARIFIRDDAAGRQLNAGAARPAEWLARLRHALRRNTRAGSRRNIEAHYDLGNDFYSLFLDPTWSYSSGVFPHPHAGMEAASLTKLELVCRKLQLTAADHLVEIGTGWGGLAIFAASRYGCRVTTTTISKEQYSLAQERIRAAGLQDRVTVLCQDYRDLRGQYDKLISIEMIEAVGAEYWSQYFQQCSRLLQPNGRMLIQAIVMSDQRFESYLRSSDFIREYIFPGGCLPSIQALSRVVSEQTDLRMLHLEDIGPHYVRTLQWWRSAFWQRIEEVRQLGFSESFIRMWDYYFAYCAAAFEERQVNNVQVVWGKPACRAVFPQDVIR